MKKIFGKKIILLSVLLLMFQMIFATDYYCDPKNGSNKNNGTKEQPWSTLESVFMSGKQFQPGDKIYLLTGDHGNVVITGENAKYIKIIGLEGEKPILNSLIFGTETAGASRWEVIGVQISGASGKVLVEIGKQSSRIRITSCEIFQKEPKTSAIKLTGENCRIENNYIHHIKNAILISGTKQQVRNNRIEFFTGNAIEISGNSNLIEYNLIRESLNSGVNNALFWGSEPVKANIIRANTIINFIKNNRKEIGILNGIFGKQVSVSESIIENNVIISNGESGIDLTGTINNTKIVNNTVVNPYFGIQFGNLKKVNSALAIKISGKGSSVNLVIRNNLVNNFIIENIKGLADHNMILPVKVHEYDRCFTNWALFDFSLGEDSKALNSGTLEFAPKTDASLNKRPLGNFVNIGAFEYTKINDANETFVIDAELSDRQIHSKGKADWDGQPQIRIGGSGEGIDGAGVFPFKLPLIPGGKEIIFANFKVYLAKIDNKPAGGVDLYGLPPKTNFWVTEDMFYQGVYGQDLKARPIQKGFINERSYTGEIHLKPQGKSGLKSYLNTIFENGSQAGDFIFLRLNPSAKDVADFNRWNISSANTDKEERKPKLEITVGYPELNKPGAPKVKSIKNYMVAAANPLQPGELTLYFLGFEKSSKVSVALFTYRGKELLKETIDLKGLKSNCYRTRKLSLPAGKYILQYTVDGTIKKEALFVW